MRILLTNDDGINAPGLTVLEEIAADIAGPDGEVWVVAPAFEQSGVAHCISYTRPMMVIELEKRRYAAEGSPADCVMVGLHDVMKDARPDLVLSGVNRGNNAGENTLYSGTIGAAMEAALQGLPAIALSQFYGPENRDQDDPFEVSRHHGAAIVRSILDNSPKKDGDYRLFYNVNFPPVRSDQLAGTRVVPQGYRPHARFSVMPQNSPTGRRFLWIQGGDQRERSAPDTDVAVNLDGYISVTPMRADLTAHDCLESLKAIE